ncbi:MAG: hypothetical protein U0840_11025 [Gemmataceae bacterium]
MLKAVETRSQAVDLHALHCEFQSILPRIENHAEIRFRYLRCPGRRADAIAEVIAISWRWFLRLTEKGKDVNSFVTVLADYAVRHVRSGRRLCGQESVRDLLSARAQCLKRFQVEHLPTSTRCSHEEIYSDPHGQNHLDAFEERLSDNAQSPIPDQAAFRVDFPQWLARLGNRNRRIAQDMALDLGTQELAFLHRVSPGRISQLRRELHADWQQFCGETAAC